MRIPPRFLLSSPDEDGRFFYLPFDSDEEDEAPPPKSVDSSSSSSAGTFLKFLTPELKQDLLKYKKNKYGGVVPKEDVAVDEYLEFVGQQLAEVVVGTKNKSGGGGDMEEDDKALCVKVDMPGLTKEDVKVSFEKHTLSITGEDAAKEKKYSKKVSVSSKKFKVGEIKAVMKNGVLSVVIPKVEKKEPVLIKID